jgi:hypothetical protein
MICKKIVRSLRIFGINFLIFGMFLSCEKEKSGEHVISDPGVVIHIYHLEKGSEDVIEVKEDSPVANFFKNVHVFEGELNKNTDSSLMVSPSVTGPYFLFADLSDSPNGEKIVYFAAAEDRSLSSHLEGIEGFDEFQGWFNNQDLSFRRSDVSLGERISGKCE